jgi:hypothetical protein
VATSAAIRDLAIILVAMASLFMYVLLGILIWQVWRLTRLVQTEIQPVIEDAQETLNTMRATTEFLSQNMVDPVVKAGSQAVATQRTMQVLWNELWPGIRKR